VIQGIRVTKFYAWEESFLSIISDIRSEELSYIKKNVVLSGGMGCLWGFVPTLISITSFGLYMARGLPLTPQVAFTALSLVCSPTFPPDIYSLVELDERSARASSRCPKWYAEL
jgi:hypothetical protein